MTEKEQKNYDKLFKSLTEMNDVNTRLDLLGQAVSPMTREIIWSINKSVYESANSYEISSLTTFQCAQHYRK